MVFNWFRRKFNDDSEQVEKEQTPTSSPEAQPESSESESEESPPAAEDYLKWAKAAYQNIQQQQQAAQTEEDESETVESEVETETSEETATSGDEPEAAPVAENDAEEAQEVPVAETETESEPEVVAETAPVAESEPETVEEIAEEESQEAPVAESESEAVEETAEEEPEAVETAVTQEEPKEAPVAESESEAVEETAEEEPEAVETAVTQEEPKEAPVAESETEAVEEPEETPVAQDEPEVVAETAEDEPDRADDDAVSDPPADEAPVRELSLFEKARAEREARLERLNQSAIETPEPEAAPAAQTTTVPEPEISIPGLAFDDGFVWSAEVLAAQGRRPEDISVEEITWLKKLRQGLDKTRRGLVNELKSIVGQGPLNKEAVMEIEALLLQADVGIEATDYAIEALQAKMLEETLPPDAAIAYLKKILRDILDRPLREHHKASIAPEKDTLNIWLMTGVNGAGKTTTIGKLAHLANTSDYRCLIAAADTFRAAAVEQVKVWGRRSNTEVIANPGKNTDPAAVVFDGIAAAQSRQTELLLVDTAGRLQNKKNLMEELNKIRRIIDRKAPDAIVESLLVLDATLGQNGLRQAEVFAEAAQLSGVVLTKLDGTAKGGVALAVVQQLGLPIRFIGAGEGIQDLRPFSSYEFVEALLNG